MGWCWGSWGSWGGWMFCVLRGRCLNTKDWSVVGGGEGKSRLAMGGDTLMGEGVDMDWIGGRCLDEGGVLMGETP